MSTQQVDLSASNLDGFAKLYASVFNSPPWSDGWSLDAVHERLSGFMQFPRFESLGLIESDQPIGLVLGWGERWVTGWHFHIKEMCIANAFQRVGVGGQLLRAFEHKLMMLQYNRIFLETSESTPSRTFYEQNGYRRMGLVSLAKRSDA